MSESLEDLREKCKGYPKEILPGLYLYPPIEIMIEILERYNKENKS